MTRVKLSQFVVEGHGVFPFDMLRYDAAWPKHETDSAAIERATRRGAVHRSERVTLATFSGSAPTAARWESFGWKVVTA